MANQDRWLFCGVDYINPIKGHTCVDYIANFWYYSAISF